MGPVRGVVLAVAAGIAMASFAAAWLVFPIHVTSNSMAPWVSAGDYGVAVYTRDVERGDVIAFRFPFGSPTLAIKRAVSLPGDCMPPHGAGAGVGQLSPAAPAGAGCDVVPPDSVFILGDNINGSVDSRHFGVVPASEIVGKVVLVVPVTRWRFR